MFQRLDLRACEPRQATGLRVLFNFPRGRIRSCDLAAPRGAGRVERVRDHHGFQFLWALPVTLESVEVVVDFEGEPPSVISWHFLPGLQPHGVPLPEREEGFSPSRVEAAVARHAYVRNLPASDCREYHEFFLDLDCRTSLIPAVREVCGLGPMPFDASGTDALLVALTDRVFERGSAFLARREPVFAPIEDPQLVRDYSGLQVEIFRRHFGDLCLRAGRRRFGAAFECFANGALQVPDGESPLPGYINCEPDSAFYYFFAEFAFMALEVGTKKRTWKHALNALVRTQEIYATAYRPYPGNPCGNNPQLAFDNYLVCNFDESLQLTPPQIEAIRRYYRRLSPDELAHQMGRNVATALRQDSQLGLGPRLGE